jgi:long-subunit acyl-CoA synthetase (AMP-forming)
MTITIPQTLAHVAADGARTSAIVPQRFKRGGSWQDLSYAELGSVVGEIAGGLGLGIQPGDRFCI